jgi:hypothetical protein
MPSDQPNPRGVTGRLNIEERHTLIIPALGSFDPRVAARDTRFYPVPSTYRTIPNPPVWRILLKFSGKEPRVLAGLDVYNDVVLGRGSGEPDSPDIDLTNLNAMSDGVSRRHALLRPTNHRLYLIDLGSTNGTFVNAIPVSKGMAQTLRSSDSVSFGGLSCIIEIVFSPLSREGTSDSPAPELKEDALSPTLKLGKPRTGMDTIVGGKITLAKPSSSPLGDIPPMTKADLDRQPEDPKKK